MSLKGRAISIGESIIIPMDVSTLATTMSMIKNGIKIKKPIWKAVLSSEVTNAGTSTRSGIASGDAI
jgi:hypothetical protein